MFPLEFPFSRAVEEPLPSALAGRYVVGAMMTPSHAHFGERLAASCRAHALPLALYEVPVVHRSINPVGADDLRFTKANFIHFLMERHRCAVLYLDVDCVMAQRPVRIDELLTARVDFAIFNWLAEEHTEAYVPQDIALREGGIERTIHNRFYRFSHSIDALSDTQLLCSGAVQWYGHTDAARFLLESWQAVIQRAPGRADDKCLDLAFNNYPASAPPLEATWLEKRYARYAWWIYEQPIIDHPSFPGSGSGFEPLHEVEGKPRIHEELVRGSKATYVFPKDCLIDTADRTLIRSYNGEWRTVGVVSVPLWLPGADAEARLRSALELHQQSRFDEAVAAYEDVLSFQPNHVQALTFLGVLGVQMRQLDRALDFADRALAVDSRNTGAHLMRGHALGGLQRREEAIASYDIAIALHPGFVDAYFHRGNVLGELGQHAAALASYDRALELNPKGADLHLARGLALFELQQYEAALAGCDSAISINPNHAEAHLTRGNALQQLRKPNAALESYDRALSINAGYAQAYSNRGNILSELQRFGEALESYDRAVSADAQCAEYHCNRGNVLMDLRRYREARTSFDRAITLDADYAQGYVSRSFLCLLMGEYETGWRDFEWRWKNQHGVSRKEKRSFGQPQWLGKEDIAGKTILLHCEQGLGDTLQFCRYTEMLAALGARVVLEAPPALHRLMKSLRGVSQLVKQGDPLPSFDCYSPLMSLPLALQSRLDEVPANLPYLRPQRERVRQWSDKLGPRTRARVGLVWSGGFRPSQPELWAVNDRRNIPLEQLALLNLPDIEFYSLQKGQPAESELSELMALGWGGPTLIDHVHELYDFEETAALIEQLDLVISVDTSTAHLAGAIGKPVWLLNRFDTCWRWLLERSDSPWYPTLRLYRQERPGSWAGVVQRVRQDLERLALARFAQP